MIEEEKMSLEPTVEIGRDEVVAQRDQDEILEQTPQVQRDTRFERKKSVRDAKGATVGNTGPPDEVTVPPLRTMVVSDHLDIDSDDNMKKGTIRYILLPLRTI